MDPVERWFFRFAGLGLGVALWAVFPEASWLINPWLSLMVAATLIPD